MARNVSLKLWLGIGVKHVVFLELWLGIASLELWLGMADEHEKPLSCGSGWRVWHLSSWEGVKGQVWGSIPTSNNPPAMRESRGEGLGCIGLQT